MTYQFTPKALTDADFLKLSTERVAIVPRAVASAVGLDVAADCAWIEHGGRRSLVRAADARKLVALASDPTARAQLAPVDPAVVTRLEAIEARITPDRTAAKRARERAISRKQAELRRIDHAFAEDRAFAAKCIDDAGRVAAQTAAHQARMAAAARPAEPAKPAPLRLVTPKYDTVDLAALVRDF
jgi:hypothetical protein